jgi:glutathione S-transferase
MRTLYIANKTYSSWSLRPWVLLKVLGIPFEEQVAPFALLGQGSNWPAYRVFSPTGKVPCLHTPTGVVWDSLGIAEYLAEQYEGVWPQAPEARAWARCASAEMHSGFTALRSQCPMNCAVEIRLNEINAALQADLDRLQELWREGLSRFGGPFLAGERFTAVDAFFCPVAFRLQTYGLKLDEACTAYAQRLLALPAMQQWRAEALAEPWIEPGHEEACLKGGTLVRDLRQG